MTDALPSVSVIVPAHNEEAMLPLCLDSLMHLDYPQKLLEIIVIDNNSTDGSARIIRDHPVRYVFEGKKGRARARNAGLQAASGEIVAFTDADAVVDRDWLRRLVPGFRQPGIGGCGGRNASFRPTTWIERFFEQEYQGFPESAETCFENYFVGTLFAASNMACRRRVLDEVGPFDEGLFASEDLDLLWRINLKGHQLNYVEDAVVYHKRPAAWSALAEIGVRYAYDHFRLIKKYEPVIGMSFAWGAAARKTGVKLGAATRQAWRGRFEQSRFDLLTAALTAAHLATAAYGWMAGALGKRVETSPLGFAPAPVIWRWDSAGNVLILDLFNKNGYRLEGAAGRIWERWAYGDAPAVIADAIHKEYGVSREDSRADVEHLISELSRDNVRPRVTDQIA